MPRATSSIHVAIREFVDSAKTVNRDVLLVFIATAMLGIASNYYGSRRFFRASFYDFIGEDTLFNLYEYLYWFVSEFIVFFIVPLGLVKLFHRRPLREFGVGLGDWRFGLKIAGIFIAVMLPILWIVSDFPDFQLVYPHVQIAKQDWNIFLVYESVFLLYFIGWEYIWRGYVLFGLEKHVGGAIAILIQMLPFTLLHYGKPMIETIGAVGAAVALGAIALRTRSFWYCVLTHWIVMFSIDWMSTLRERSDVQGIGFDAFAKVFLYFFN